MSPQAAAALERPDGPRFEIADVVRLYGRRFKQTHTVSLEQRAVLRAIESCRTAALGGHVDECDRCRERSISYNSCRNRHCPKCQGGNQAKWVDVQQASLLPIEYFHVVFTLPHALNPLVRKCSPHPVWSRRDRLVQNGDRCGAGTERALQAAA